MEQVVHHLGLGAVLLYLQIKGRIHVHCHRLDLLAVLTQQFEERANRLPTVAMPDPQHTRPFGIHDHRGVAMPFMESELVHDQATNLSGLEPADGRLQATLVELFEGVPMQTRETADVTDGQQLQQTFEPGAQARGQT